MSSSSLRATAAGFAVTFSTPIVGWARPGDAGAAVAVGLRKIADRLAADEVVLEAAVGDEVDGLCGHAFVVDVVGADEAFAVEGLQAGIVDDVEKVGQHTRVVAGLAKGPLVRASVPSAGARRHDGACQRGSQRVGAGVGAEQDGAVILLFNQRGLAQIVERGDDRLRRVFGRLRVYRGR